MKKAAVLFSMLSFCLALAAFDCGEVLAQTRVRAAGEPEEEEQPPAEPVPEPAPADKPVEPAEGEKAKEDDHWNTFLGSIFGNTLQGVGLTFSDAVFKDRGLRYRAYPYSSKEYVFSDKKRPPRGAPGVLKLEYQRINPNLYSLTCRLTLRMTSGFDFSLTDTLYDERQRNHDHDRTRYTRMRLSYLLSPVPGNLLIRPGMGFTLFGDRSGADIGIEIDCFPQDPFTFHAGVCHTFITNHHGITDIDIALGIMAGPFEFALGYRGLATKDENINGIYFSVGFWF
jgi:hypothetical protein